MPNSPDCIFCRIVAGEIPSTKLHEDETTVAFADVNPQAPVHILVIPRDHVPSLADLPEAGSEVAGHLLLTAARVAREAGLEEAGYRVVTNIGSDGGQSVGHLHLHVLGGRAMGWPPG